MDKKWGHSNDGPMRYDLAKWYFNQIFEIHSILPYKKQSFRNTIENLKAFNKAVGPGKKSKISKRRAYVYSGL